MGLGEWRANKSKKGRKRKTESNMAFLCSQTPRKRLLRSRYHSKLCLIVKGELINMAERAWDKIHHLFLTFLHYSSSSY